MSEPDDRDMARLFRSEGRGSSGGAGRLVPGPRPPASGLRPCGRPAAGGRAAAARLTGIPGITGRPGITGHNPCPVPGPAQLPRWSIAVVTTTTMLHRRGSAGRPAGSGNAVRCITGTTRPATPMLTQEEPHPSDIHPAVPAGLDPPSPQWSHPWGQVWRLTRLLRGRPGRERRWGWPGGGGGGVVPGGWSGRR
jgi:hypothetical protein